MIRTAFVEEACRDVDLQRARVLAAMAEEVAERRKYWLAGIPNELDLYAARKAVARRLKVSCATVEGFLATPVLPSAEP